MKPTQTQRISDVRACVFACVCEFAPREAVTTVGFVARCVYVESAAVSSHQCSWNALNCVSILSLLNTRVANLIFSSLHLFFPSVLGARLISRAISV